MPYIDQIDKRLSEAWIFYSRCSLYATTLVGHKSSKASVIAINENDKIVYITALYSDGWALLLERYNEVSSEYLRRRKVAPYFIILNIDRKDAAVVASVNSVKEDMKEVMRQLRDYLNPNSQTPVVIQKIICPPQWDILEESSKLLMEEITFLSKRVDDITNMMIGLVAQALTLVVILVAVFALGYQIYSDRYKDEIDAKKAAENTSHLYRIDKSIRIEQRGISDLNNEIFAMQFCSASTYDQDFSRDIQNLNEKIDALSLSLTELKTGLQEKPSPTIIINNNMPSQPPQAPSKKAIGIINVQSH
jgi:hypothetical protein